MLPFAQGVTGYRIEQGGILFLELNSLRNLKSRTFTIKDSTIINTIKQGFSPILEDYLGDSVPGFSDAFMEMMECPIPDAGEEKELEVYPNTKMKFCWIPAGKAILGSPESEAGRIADEIEHEFETNGFWLGKYEVTQAQWEAVMDKNPSNFKGANLPVENVSWNDCQDFIKKCSASGLKLQLPHEDQWEYACRGGKGNKQPFYWGDALKGDKANCNGNYPYGTDKKGANLEKMSEVGSYEKVAPHPWGLCDMSGNVYEWCGNLYIKESPGRAFRGGCWGDPSWGCRSSMRYGFVPTFLGDYLGFRLIIC